MRKSRYCPSPMRQKNLLPAAIPVPESPCDHPTARDVQEKI